MSRLRNVARKNAAEAAPPAALVFLLVLAGCAAPPGGDVAGCDCGNILAEYFAPEMPGRHEDPRSFYIHREEEALAELDRAIRTQNDEIYAAGRRMRQDALERHWKKRGIIPPVEVRDEL